MISNHLTDEPERDLRRMKVKSGLPAATSFGRVLVGAGDRRAKAQTVGALWSAALLAA
jgi:hypothetical protein